MALALTSVAAFSACAQAAMVSPKSGEVRVGTGHGFQLIVAPTEVAAGAQVMVSPKGAASIAYSDDCVVSAPAAAITIVESRAPCAGFPQPSYFGFAQSTEEGIGTPLDPAFEPLHFTPKVDAPETSDAPGPSTGRKPRGTRPVLVEGGHWEHDGLLIMGGVAVGAGALALLLGSGSGGGESSANGSSSIPGAVLGSQGANQPASP